MLIVSHRRNTLDDIRSTPTDYGVEIDIRSRGERLIVVHDPYIAGVSFAEWIKEYRHSLLILNVKEEGLEQRLLAEMRHHNIEKFFFLDQSFPFLVKTALSGEQRCAVRVSEYEHIETALSLAGKIEWVWVDCFTRYPLSSEDTKALRAAGFKLCLVSPELQGRSPEAAVADLRRQLEIHGDIPDAVCTKRPDLWA